MTTLTTRRVEQLIRVADAAAPADGAAGKFLYDHAHPAHRTDHDLTQLCAPGILGVLTVLSVSDLRCRREFRFTGPLRNVRCDRVTIAPVDVRSVVVPAHAKGGAKWPVHR